jgi:hypothetical protein
MPVLFGGIWAPSTLGPFLRSFTWGMLELQKVNPAAGRAGRRAPLLPGKDVVAFPVSARSKPVSMAAGSGPAGRSRRGSLPAWHLPGHCPA